MSRGDNCRQNMNDESNKKSLEKWEVLKGVDGKQKADITLFHAFQTYTGDDTNRMSSALFVTTKDEVYAVGQNNEDNLLAITGDEFGKVVAVKKPRKIDGLSGRNIRKIAVSERFGAALTGDGRLIYWGTDMKSLQYELREKKYVKEPHEPREDFKITDMACGANSITFVTDENQVLIWGCINLYYSNFYDFERVPWRKTLQVKGIAAGWYHVALLDQNGHVWTFGYGSVGQLGYKRVDSNEITPRKVSLPQPCQKVECGAYSTLFLLNNGELYACGSNSQSDYLCVGKAGYVSSPTKVLLNDNIADIAATYAWSSGKWQSLFSAAAKDSVKYFKWGDNPKIEKPENVDDAHSLLDLFANFKTPQSLGNLDRNDLITLSNNNVLQTTQSSPLASKSILERWWILDVLDDDFIRKVRSFSVFKGISVSVKNVFGAFIVTTEDEVYSWGYNGWASASLGLGSDEIEIKSPTKVKNLSGRRIKKILANPVVGSLAVSEDGVLFVWAGKSVPMEEENLRGKTVVDVADGQSFYIYLLANSEVYCVFLNGREIMKTSEEDHIKVGVPEGENAVALAAGMRHFVVLTDKSNVYAYIFKASYHGKIGDEWESYDDSRISRLKINPEPCKKIMAANRFSYFLTEKGKLYRFGFTYYLDFPSFTEERVLFKPENVAVNEEIVDIVGTYYVFALKTKSGKVYKWSDTNEPEEVKEATLLVEAFEEEEIPGALSLVRLSNSSATDGSDGRVTGYNGAVRKNNFFSDPLYSDITIKLKDGVIPAHKVFLHTKSAFFGNVLSSNKLINQDELDLVSYNPKAIRALLKFIYDLPVGRWTSSLKDVFDFRKLALEDGNPDLIKIADDIVLKNSVFDKQYENVGAMQSKNEAYKKDVEDFMESNVFP